MKVAVGKCWVGNGFVSSFIGRILVAWINNRDESGSATGGGCVRSIDYYIYTKHNDCTQNIISLRKRSTFMMLPNPQSHNHQLQRKCWGHKHLTHIEKSFHHDFVFFIFSFFCLGRDFPSCLLTKARQPKQPRQPRGPWPAQPPTGSPGKKSRDILGQKDGIYLPFISFYLSIYLSVNPYMCMYVICK